MDFKIVVWQAFSRQVALLHCENTLRNDFDNVGQVVYDSDSNRVIFPPHPPGAISERAATTEELAHNLVPLMRLVFGSRNLLDPAGVWEIFENIYVQTMDERGPQIIATLHDIRGTLQAASELNKKALGLAYIGKTDEARDTFEQVLSLREDSGDVDGYCGTLCNLALLNADTGDPESSHGAVDRAIRIARERGRSRAWSLALFQKALLYKRESKQARALKYADLAVHTWTKTNGPVPEQFIALLDSIREQDH